MPELRYDPLRQCWVSIAVEVIPRLIQSHGFERGMGFYVNFTRPKRRPLICGKWKATCPDLKFTPEGE